VQIATPAAPIVLEETDYSGSERLWRIVLDGGVIRFDVNTGTNFSNYSVPVTMKYINGARVGINRTNPDYTLDVNGTIRGSNVTPSDMRWKKEIVTLINALERVTQLRGVNYKWIHPEKGDGLQMGVIAQEVEAVFPEAISTDSQGYKSVNYDSLVAALIEAFKELKAENDALKQSHENTNAELEGVKAKMIQLESAMQSLKALMVHQSDFDGMGKNPSQ
jgi:hypothetical protein